MCAYFGLKHDSLAMCDLRVSIAFACHFSGVFSKLYDKLPPTRKVLHSKMLPVPIYIMGINGVKNSHIVLKA